MPFDRIIYNSDLNSKQKENYNFHKASSILAEYGYHCIPLNDDWNGADFLALHVAGFSLKVQLKGRMGIEKRYIGKELWICFPYDRDIYVYPHDETVQQIFEITNVENTQSWQQGGAYTWPSPSAELLQLIEQYRLTLQDFTPNPNGD